MVVVVARYPQDRAGDVRFHDPEAGTGNLAFGAVEWTRAGGGVWHGKELSGGKSQAIQGFQLWVALPPELKNGTVDSQYVEASQMKSVGPATIILDEYGGAVSPVRAPEGMNYLLVKLAPERNGHTGRRSAKWSRGRSSSTIG